MSDRRLIEDSLPLAEISVHSAWEKSIRRGHISALHWWWARRPLAAARAVTMAALLPAPRDDEERQSFHRLIVDNLDWELGKDPKKHAKDLREIMDKHGVVKNPKILDPFAGGGALPLEAMRLGAEAYATDLNPVAHLIELATLYYPQRFSDLPPRNGDGNSEFGQARLASEIQRWARVVQERVSAELAPYYQADNGDQPLFYFWARTAQCQNPACQAEIPLMGSFILQKNESHTLALVPTVSEDRKSVALTIVENPKSINVLSSGTIQRAAAVCPCCQQATSSTQLKSIGMSGKFGHRMVAVAFRDGSGEMRFRVPTDAEVRRAKDTPLPPSFGDFSTIPDEPLPLNDTDGFFVPPYGLRTWGSLYSPRQALAMATFARHVRDLEPEIQAENLDLGDANNDFAAAVVTYLGLFVSKLADFCSTITVMKPARTAHPRRALRMRPMRMTWD